jgi:hypothetical protein
MHKETLLRRIAGVSGFENGSVNKAGQRRRSSLPFNEVVRELMLEPRARKWRSVVEIEHEVSSIGIRRIFLVVGELEIVELGEFDGFLDRVELQESIEDLCSHVLARILGSGQASLDLPQDGSSEIWQVALSKASHRVGDLGALHDPEIGMWRPWRGQRRRTLERPVELVRILQRFEKGHSSPDLIRFLPKLGAPLSLQRLHDVGVVGVEDEIVGPEFSLIIAHDSLRVAVVVQVAQRQKSLAKLLQLLLLNEVFWCHALLGE